jgi:exopolyphosphatase/guanosine-5'-triphosphate,3'-diphosphate pyrophosphatase
MRIAAVDIGTNTVRLLVADVEGDDLDEIERGREITRLGQGVDADRSLHPEAMERTLSAIETFVGRARELGAEHIRVAGTSALRDAADRDRFVETVTERTGMRLEILAGPDEGRLSLRGATLGLPHGSYVVLDIGGGSTEISTATASVSLDIGSVRLKERFLRGDPPTHDEVASARHFVDDHLDAAAKLSIGGYETLVGVAGTITTLAALVAGLSSYDREVVHGSKMRKTDVTKQMHALLEMRAAEIKALGPVDAGRADVVGGGVLILHRVMTRFLFEELLVSETDILDGLVLDAAKSR